MNSLYRLFFAPYVLILSLGFHACSIKPQETVLNKKPVNVLFIAVDDLKPLLGCYGHKDIITPNIDKLASQGFIFENNHCQQAVCGPSRASILTGMRPDYTQIWDLKTLIRDKRPDIITMPQYFKQNGFQTAAVGKIFDFRSVDKGNDMISWSIPYDDCKRKKGLANDYAKTNQKVSYEINEMPDDETTDGVVAQKTIELLRTFASNDKPFFMAAGFYKPHLPFVANKKYWDMYDVNMLKLPDYRKSPDGAPIYAAQPSWELRGGYVDVPKDYNTPIPMDHQKKMLHGYYACVSFIDQQIGLIVDELDKLGLRENTVIVIWGDHGFHLGDHDMWCKHTNYEQATRSPLIFSLGKKVVGKTQKPSEFIDVYPTLCEMAGLPLPSFLEGKSLNPIMTNKAKSVKDYAVSQFTRENDKMGYAFRDERYRYIVWMKDFTSVTKYNENLLVGEELYDYKSDPEERKNLINTIEYRTIKVQMKKQMMKFFEERRIHYENQ
jgi:iduronate 2-sulfatase